jgi:hypothetical protein
MQIRTHIFNKISNIVVNLAADDGAALNGFLNLNGFQTLNDFLKIIKVNI